MSDNPFGECLGSVKDLAEHLGVDECWIYRNLEELKIPHHRFKKHLRFSPTEIKEWEAEHKG